MQSLQRVEFQQAMSAICPQRSPPGSSTPAPLKRNLAGGDASPGSVPSAPARRWRIPQTTQKQRQATANPPARIEALPQSQQLAAQLEAYTAQGASTARLQRPAPRPRLQQGGNREWPTASSGAAA